MRNVTDWLYSRYPMGPQMTELALYLTKRHALTQGKIESVTLGNTCTVIGRVLNISKIITATSTAHNTPSSYAFLNGPPDKHTSPGEDTSWK